MRTLESLTPESIPPSEIEAAQERLRGVVYRTPLVRFHGEDSGPEIYLKLECLQAIGSFKLRGAYNALAQAEPNELGEGVWTASAGNMAQGVAWCAQRLGLSCKVVVPDHAPRTKLEAIHRLGGETLPVPFAEWWQILLGKRDPGLRGYFVHPVSDPAVIAGNGTIGLEILEDLPDVDTVLVPFGGGGLVSGVALALRSNGSGQHIYACEVETAAPLAASLAAGQPREIEYRASFVDGIGSSSVIERMWPLVSALVKGSLVVTLEEVAMAVRLLLERNRVVAEGAGAASLAAALSQPTVGDKIVCVVSGGNIDRSKLASLVATDRGH